MTNKFYRILNFVDLLFLYKQQPTMRITLLILLLLGGCLNMKMEKQVRIDENNLPQSDTTSVAVAVDSAEATATAPAEEEKTREAKAEKKPHGNGNGGLDGIGSDNSGGVAPAPKPFPRTHHIHYPAQADESVAVDTMVVEKDNGMGIITYYVPDTMKVGIESKISLRIAKKNSVSISIGIPQPAVKKEIRVGRTMQAVVEQTAPDSSDFKIQSLNSAVQSIENDTSYTTWEWSVQPLKSGKHGLKLVVVIKENDLVKDIPVYEDKIYVYSSPLFSVKHFVGNNWQYLMSSMVIPIFAWWFNKRKKKKSDEDSNAE